MNGTLALWYDPIDEDKDDQHPKIELHFNLWRDMENKPGLNFLDIGIKFKSNLQNLKRFKLYVPEEVRASQLTDLFEVLKYGQTLDAVFNSVTKRCNDEDKSFSFEIDGQ